MQMYPMQENFDLISGLGTFFNLGAACREMH